MAVPYAMNSYPAVLSFLLPEDLVIMDGLDSNVDDFIKSLLNAWTRISCNNFATTINQHLVEGFDFSTEEILPPPSVICHQEGPTVTLDITSMDDSTSVV